MKKAENQNEINTHSQNTHANNTQQQRHVAFVVCSVCVFIAIVAAYFSPSIFVLFPKRISYRVCSTTTNRSDVFPSPFIIFVSSLLSFCITNERRRWRRGLFPRSISYFFLCFFGAVLFSVHFVIWFDSTLAAKMHSTDKKLIRPRFSTTTNSSNNIRTKWKF